MKKKIFMVGNAHLDPAWMWRWQEGSCEAKATIRSALDRMKEYPDFKFVCSSACVYQWIEIFSPEMFKEVKERISEGRFIIVGGWHVQPDCNMPSGEGFSRQGLYSQRYFKEKFGVISKIGYNVDSFGHNVMLPQILKKSGMDYYIFMRPDPNEKELEAELFNWFSPDGSSVLTTRILGPYCFNITNIEELSNHINEIEENSVSGSDALIMFYGVGNHGGGPTIQNINIIHEYQKLHPEYEIIFADPVEFFEEIKKEKINITEHHDDFQHHASGCYSAVSQIKSDIRKCETSLCAAENYSVLAGHLTSLEYPGKIFEEGWKNTLFNHFHDIFCGCSIPEVYNDAAIFNGETLSIAAKAENNALQRISWSVDTSDASKGIPVIVFNPLNWDVETVIKINKQVSGITDINDNPVKIQHVQSPALSCQWRSDTIFKAKIPSFGYTAYFLKDENQSEQVKTVSAHDNVLENSRLIVTFDTHTGYIASIYDKKESCHLLSGEGAVPVVIDEWEHDTWSHGKNFFNKQIAKFADGEICITEDGPVRASVKVISRYNQSTLTQCFSLTEESGRLETEVKIDWHEKHKMLKLAFDCNIINPHAFYEIPFGNIECPCNGEEETGQMWVAMKGDNGGIAMLNDCKYSFSAEASVLNLTVVRSPIFGDHGGPRNNYCEYTDQGIHTFKYSIMPFKTDGWYKIVRSARELNFQPVNIIENNHNGNLPTEYSGIQCNCSNIIISAVKRSEDKKGLVVRAYETDGKSVCAKISGPVMRKTLTAEFTPYSVMTFKLDDEEERWREVMITEYDFE